LRSGAPKISRSVFLAVISSTPLTQLLPRRSCLAALRKSLYCCFGSASSAQTDASVRLDQSARPASACVPRDPALFFWRADRPCANGTAALSYCL
jgi:hypothetical protein